MNAKARQDKLYKEYGRPMVVATAPLMLTPVGTAVAPVSTAAVAGTAATFAIQRRNEMLKFRGELTKLQMADAVLDDAAVRRLTEIKEWAQRNDPASVPIADSLIARAQQPVIYMGGASRPKVTKPKPKGTPKPKPKPKPKQKPKPSKK